MPPYFPLVRPGCEEISRDFFDCYDNHCEPWGSKKAAEYAFIACKEKQVLYEKCTTDSLAKGPPSASQTEY